MNIDFYKFIFLPWCRKVLKNWINHDCRLFFFYLAITFLIAIVIFFLFDSFRGGRALLDALFWLPHASSQHYAPVSPLKQSSFRCAENTHSSLLNLQPHLPGPSVSVAALWLASQKQWLHVEWLTMRINKRKKGAWLRLLFFCNCYWSRQYTACEREALIDYKCTETDANPGSLQMPDSKRATVTLGYDVPIYSILFTCHDFANQIRCSDSL